jgi:hypothetical protein
VRLTLENKTKFSVAPRIDKPNYDERNNVKMLTKNNHSKDKPFNLSPIIYSVKTFVFWGVKL